MDEREEERLHDSVNLVGLRAHATAVGLLKLTSELVRAGVLEEVAVDRIKEAIVKELSLSRSRSASKQEFERTTRLRLDALFAGDERLGEQPPKEMAP
ncbi:MAG TPA: hypothetical protein VFE10_11550 [Phenylobacterium sp.]|nr:hypothetical protein [Phenylobacterium sp.]